MEPPAPGRSAADPHARQSGRPLPGSLYYSTSHNPLFGSGRPSAASQELSAWERAHQRIQTNQAEINRQYSAIQKQQAEEFFAKKAAEANRSAAAAEEARLKASDAKIKQAVDRLGEGVERKPPDTKRLLGPKSNWRGKGGSGNLGGASGLQKSTASAYGTFNNPGPKTQLSLAPVSTRTRYGGAAVAAGRYSGILRVGGAGLGNLVTPVGYAIGDQFRDHSQKDKRIGSLVRGRR